MKKLFYTLLLLLMGINQLSAQHAYLNLYTTGRGKVVAEYAQKMRLPISIFVE